MTTKNKNIPALRFKEFSEEWELKKLNDIFIIKYGKDYKNLSKGSIPLIGTGGIMGYVNDFLYDKESVLIGRKGSITKPQFINIPFWTVDTLFYTEIKDEYIPYFVYLIISNINWLKYNEATGVPSLNTQSINNVNVFISVQRKEQQKIATFLTAVDDKIQQLTRKKTLLEKYKKAVMQQIFSQQIRFKDDNGNDYPEWEEKRLGEITEIKTGKRNLEDKIENGHYPFFVRSANIEKINSYSYDGEAILIPGDGKIGEIFHYINGKFDYHQRVYKISDAKNISIRFIYFYLSLFFYKHAMSFTVKATVDSLRLPIIQNFNISIPCLAEQMKTTFFLNSIDKKITNCDLQITNCKQWKKGLLQKMFI